MNKAGAIADFWEWFSGQAWSLAELYEAKQFDELVSLVNSRLNAIDEELPWEIGPGVSSKYAFTLSPEGNERLRKLVKEILSVAPQLEEWEFNSSRQPRPAPAKVHLPMRDLSFSTDRWRFIPMEDASRSRINLAVIDETLSTAGREDGLKAISIFLDQFLGEGTAEDWIGRIEIESFPGDRKCYPIRELPDYILWARNRKNSPLTREKSKQ